MQHKIAIIGGGGSGAALVISLINQLRQRSTSDSFLIQIFEVEELGAGLAYGVEESCFLLNTSVGVTSLVYEDPLHFFKWLKAKRTSLIDRYPELISFDENSFLPRSLVKLYAQDTIGNLLKTVDPSKIVFEQIKEWVTEIEYREKKFSIQTNTGQYAAQFCVLATGYSNAFSNTYSDLLETPNYFPSPYFFTEKIKKIPFDKKILIIGTRLSAIDTVMLLKDHRSITMGSHSGILPAVRDRVRIFPAKHLTPQYQGQLFKRHRDDFTLDLLRKEIENELCAVYRRKISLEDLDSVVDTLQRLKIEIDLVDQNLHYWVDSMMTFVDFLNTAWEYLNDADRKLFASSSNPVHYFLRRYISSFPRQNAEVIYHLIKNGHLKILSGLHRIDYQTGRYVAKFRKKLERRSQADFRDEIFDFVINAAPAEPMLINLKNEFYKKLKETGMVQFNEFGGLVVNSEFQLANMNGSNDYFYAIGPILRGTVLINFLLVFSQEAEIVAKKICEEL